MDKFRTNAVFILIGIFLLWSSVFFVREGETGMVLQFGRVARNNISPGVHFKVPVIERAVKFDRRLLILPAEPERYLTAERKDINVDFFALASIIDPQMFYRATGGNEEQAVQRLTPIVKDALRNEINARTLSQVVSGSRAEIIKSQLDGINKAAETVGIKIVDLRIKQIELPTDSEVIKNVYSRMSAQRQQVASRLRAEGEEQAQTIRAEADRDVAVILAEAKRDAQVLRGEGDSEATRIMGQAAAKDQGFFAFQRSLDAYRKAFNKGDSVIVLDSNDPFLKYMKADR